MCRGTHTGRVLRLIAAASAVLLPLLCASPTSAAPPGHGRAWELVTSGPTNGVRPFATAAWANDGTRVVYLTLGPMPGTPSGDLVAVSLESRGPDGWTKQPLGEPLSQPLVDLQASAPLAVDGDFAAWVWRSDLPLLPDAPHNAYYRRAPDGTLTLLGAVGNTGDARFVAASRDTRHVVFQSAAHLLPADAGRIAGGDAYELDGNELRLVGVDTAGSPLSACGSTVGNGHPEDDLLTRPVSSDGTRIWFSAPASGDCGGTSRVYLRTNGAQTVEASASACHRLDCGAPADVHFAGASRDGSAAFLTTAEQLTDDDADTAVDLYRYDVADHQLTRLSGGPPGVGAEVNGTAVASSDDGTRVYFIALGALVPGHGEPGRPNLYLSDRGTLHFVATVDDLDLHRLAVSSDGRVAAFPTSLTLLPSDLDARVDLYRYDEQSGAPRQISLGDDGRGNETADVVFGTMSQQHPLQQDDMRYLSGDGRRVVFMTSEALVADDVNAGPDIYEWADGSVALVSSGAGDSSLVYEGLSADGSSVFFATDETLVPADRNGGDEDLYVARLGGGFPDPPPAPAACVGDACQGPLGPRLSRPALPTLLHIEPARTLRIHALSAHARARLAAAGQAVVVLDVPAPGRVTLLVRIGDRPTVVARGLAAPRAAGRVRVRVHLAAAARQLLQRQHVLHLTLTARQADQVATRRLTVRVRRRR